MTRLNAARVALEEEALERAQLRAPKVGPHGGDRLGDGVGLVTKIRALRSEMGGPG